MGAALQKARRKMVLAGSRLVIFRISTYSPLLTSLWMWRTFPTTVHLVGFGSKYTPDGTHARNPSSPCSCWAMIHADCLRSRALSHPSGQLATYKPSRWLYVSHSVALHATATRCTGRVTSLWRSIRYTTANGNVQASTRAMDDLFIGLFRGINTTNRSYGHNRSCRWCRPGRAAQSPMVVLSGRPRRYRRRRPAPSPLCRPGPLPTGVLLLPCAAQRS